MVNIRSLDPSASPLDYYGYELRRLREQAGLNQAQLGDILYCTGSLIGQIETARKVPTREFSERLDAALMTDGLFSRLVGLVLKSQLPSWFRPYVEMEQKATYLYSFEGLMVYGLLQTEGYARALMGARFENDLDGLVAARIERQRILEREHPPLLWAIMTEAVLRQEVGGRKVMRDQLAHLLAMQEREWVKIQILPFAVGAHAGSLGSFTLLRFSDDPDLVYTEDFVQGHMTVDSTAFKDGSLRYDHLRAAALSVEDSSALITRVMEEHYGDQPEPGGSELA